MLRVRCLGKYMAPAALRGDVPGVETVQAPPVWITSGRLDWVLIRVSIQHGTARIHSCTSATSIGYLQLVLIRPWCHTLHATKLSGSARSVRFEFQYVHSS